VPTNDRKRKEDRKIEAIYSQLKNDGIYRREKHRHRP
jgi:hypothetical protein